MDNEIVDRFRIIIVGDKGCDSEENHMVARRYGLFAIMPARNEDAPIHRTRGENRKRMKRHLPEEYNRRSIVETVHSVIKIIACNLRRILVLKVIFIIEDFYKAIQTIQLINRV